MIREPPSPVHEETAILSPREPTMRRCRPSCLLHNILRTDGPRNVWTGSCEVQMLGRFISRCTLFHRAGSTPSRSTTKSFGAFSSGALLSGRARAESAASLLASKLSFGRGGRRRGNYDCDTAKMSATRFTESLMDTEQPTRSLHRNRRSASQARALRVIGRWIRCQRPLTAAVG